MTAAAPETPATPGQAAYEAYLAHLQGADPGYGQWVKPFAAIDKHDRDAWEAAARAAIAARQPQTAPLSASQVRRHAEQPAPELAAAMAETRQLRTALRTLASLWDASSDKDEETGARPNRARLVFEERATVRRNCAADIRKLAGPEGK